MFSIKGKGLVSQSSKEGGCNVPAGLGPVLAVSAGASHTCAPASNWTSKMMDPMLPILAILDIWVIVLGT